jgi:RimJ/RimL family protein N-acetyltransferase
MKYLLQGQNTGRLLFRNIVKEDFLDWLPFFEDPETSKYWVMEKEEPSVMCEKWYEKQFARYENDRGGMNALVEKKSGRLIGHAGLLVQRVDDVTELEIAYSILPAFWNSGFASEAAQACREYAFKNNFAESLISIISVTNIPSESVARKNGMTIDKITVYNNNTVNIFRITKATWAALISRS